MEFSCKVALILFMVVWDLDDDGSSLLICMHVHSWLFFFIRVRPPIMVLLLNVHVQHSFSFSYSIFTKFMLSQLHFLDLFFRAHRLCSISCAKCLPPDSVTDVMKAIKSLYSL